MKMPCVQTPLVPITAHVRRDIKGMEHIAQVGKSTNLLTFYTKHATEKRRLFSSYSSEFLLNITFQKLLIF